jgi:hypothetical protein
MENRQTSSGVSLAITNTMTSYENHKPLIENASKSEFTIKIANTLEEREAVFQLGYQIYLEKGYIKENTNQWLIQNYDFDSETAILIVQDRNKKIAGSVTIVFDGHSKLPATSIYGEEIHTLRKSGCRMAELSRLVISPEFRNSKEILVLLFNYLAIYIHHVKKYNSFVVQVNPRHKNYYKTLLNFEEIGQEKPCPHVQSAPAVLLYLATSNYQLELIRCKSNKDQPNKERSLYPHFLTIEQEKLVTYYLEKQIKPMSNLEKQYFGYMESGINRAVCA